MRLACSDVCVCAHVHAYVPCVCVCGHIICGGWLSEFDQKINTKSHHVFVVSRIDSIGFWHCSDRCSRRTYRTEILILPARPSSMVSFFCRSLCALARFMLLLWNAMRCDGMLLLLFCSQSWNCQVNRNAPSCEYNRMRV